MIEKSQGERGNLEPSIDPWVLPDGAAAVSATALGSLSPTTLTTSAVPTSPLPSTTNNDGVVLARLHTNDAAHCPTRPLLRLGERADLTAERRQDVVRPGRRYLCFKGYTRVQTYYGGIC